MSTKARHPGNILRYAKKQLLKQLDMILETVRRFNWNPTVFVSDTEVVWKKQVFYTLTMNEDIFRCLLGNVVNIKHLSSPPQPVKE